MSATFIIRGVLIGVVALFVIMLLSVLFG